MSGPQDVACATCHHPQSAYAEARDLSLGVSGTGLGRFRRDGTLVKRNSPTVLNVAFNGIDESGRYDPATAVAFWDNRIRSLESQALEPLKSFEEMRGDTYPEDEAIARVVAKLQANAEYQSLFTEAFGSEQPVTAENLGRAVAAFMRSLLANNAPFDRYMRGDRSAMTREQIRGMERFEEIGCIRCHNGAHVLRLQTACYGRARQPRSCIRVSRRPPPTEAAAAPSLRGSSLRSRVLQRPEQRATAMRFARRRCETSN